MRTLKLTNDQINTIQDALNTAELGVLKQIEELNKLPFTKGNENSDVIKQARQLLLSLYNKFGDINAGINAGQYDI